ncbi:glycosyltransferase family 2 protein [Psychrobacter sp. I-STPA10]|uniref:glycosyltransferase family 2 protein n=1 Tax=Psychrobacter sp. I-STPA10 TaxID=2585769 RepID=UPI001E464DD1|nr:glycosyltransferase family 2 protein [Psychrobacter sp. I-STPA10]
MATRLGLYQTVLDTNTLLRTKRQIVVKFIVQVKRDALSLKEVKIKLEEILFSRKYTQFHHEIVSEVVTYQPEIILNWLNREKKYLESSYYMGLYFALLTQYQSSKLVSILNIRLITNFSIEKANIDQLCLISNILYVNLYEKLENINHMFSKFSLSKIGLDNLSLGFQVNNYTLNLQNISTIDSQALNKVSIIVTAYNAEETLRGCIESLLYQTWSNIEVIIVNDCSTDMTLMIAKQLQSLDNRIIVVDLPRNVGTFVAKSIGALYVTGEFVTCQDSDDWAHPEKIYEQIFPLIQNQDLVATTSYWLRIDKQGVYHARHIYPFFRQNPASPMFRFNTVKNEVGLWHIIRTGADSEFIERLKLIYGKNKIQIIKKPLTIGSHRENSLMTSDKYGAYNKNSLLERLDYWEAWRKWHIESFRHYKHVFMPNIKKQVQQKRDVFSGTPENLKIDKQDVKISIYKHQVFYK